MNHLTTDPIPFPLQLPIVHRCLQKSFGIQGAGEVKGVWGATGAVLIRGGGGGDAEEEASGGGVGGGGTAVGVGTIVLLVVISVSGFFAMGASDSDDPQAITITLNEISNRIVL